MQFRQAIPFVGAAAVIVLALTGCVGQGAPDDTTGSSFVFATGEPDHLTPARQTVAYDQLRTLFTPLVSVDAEGEISYAQAESVKSDDATTWTIALRDGWTFHNGEPVTAESYVKAWNTAALATNAWDNSGQLANILGYSDLNPAEGEPTATEMSGLTVVDERTFTVELIGADSQFPLQLGASQTAFFPMPEAAYDDLEAYDRKPIGNGPYQMTEAWKDTQPFTVTAYEDYKGTKPDTQSIEFRAYADQLTAYTDVLAGNADVLFLPTAKMTSAQADFGDRLYSFEAPGVDYLGFPLWDERYAKKELRQAISMAIDRDAVNKAIYGGLYALATSLTAPAMNGDPAGICGKFCEFDPDEAKALLEEAGGFDGQMQIVFPGGIGLDPLFEAYANQIRQNLGIEDVVATPTTDWAEYYQALVDETVTGPHFGHWGALYGSQQSTLRSMYTKDGACFVCTAYAEPEVAELLNLADGALTLEESYVGYREVQERVLQDFPVVPTFSNTYSYVTSDKIAELPAVEGSAVLSEVKVN